MSIEKMTFKAYTDNTFKTEVKGIEPFVAQVNPDTFSRKLSVSWAADQRMNSQNSEGKRAGIGAENYSFKLLFDGTGIVDGTRDVQAKIGDFLNVVYKLPKSCEEAGSTAYVRIAYCGEVFSCMANSININYTLFSADGTPLRASLDCSFTSVSEPKPAPKKRENTAGSVLSIFENQGVCCCQPPSSCGDVEKLRESGVTSLFNITKENYGRH